MKSPKQFAVSKMDILRDKLSDLSLDRPLQILGVLHFTLLFLFVGYGMVLIFLYMLLMTNYYYIPLTYLGWYVYDRKISRQGGRRSDWVRRWSLFRWSAAYFPLKLIKTSELHPGKNYILACHPHGVMCQSHFVNFASEATGFSNLFPGIKSYLCVLAAQFKYPFYREYFLLSGSIEASRESIDWALSKEGNGNALALVVGGAREALDARPGCYRLKLKDRKGFCKRALMHGASLVPVYAFGENDLFRQVDNPSGSRVRRFQDILTHILGFSPPIFYGRAKSLVPFSKPVHTVVGAPVDVDKVENPTQQQVDDLHSRYCVALEELFEDHKLSYGLQESDHLTLY